MVNMLLAVGVGIILFIFIVVYIMRLDKGKINTKTKKQKKHKEKFSTKKRVGLGTGLAGFFAINGIAGFFLYNKFGLAILAVFVILMTILLFIVVGYARGSISSIQSRIDSAMRRKQQNKETEDLARKIHEEWEREHGDWVGDDPAIWNKAYASSLTEDDEGNLVNDDGVIISPVTNTDTTYQEDPRRAI